MLFLVSCSEAGVLPGDASTSNNTDTAEIEYSGVVGIGTPLVNATISVVDVSDMTSPVVLLSTSSDGTGYFSISLDDTESELLFVASGGSYIDPLTFQTVTNDDQSLKGVWRKSALSNPNAINITPLSTLEASFFNCLAASPTLTSDPLDYSAAIFNTVFGINLNTVEDAYLNQSVAYSELNILYSLYNLGFARMAKEKRATSALDVVTNFAEQLTEECDLLGPVGIISGQYAFHGESFRRDYLNALANLQTETSLDDWTDEVDLDAVVEDVRESVNILFEFGAYDL